MRVLDEVEAAGELGASEAAKILQTALKAVATVIARGRVSSEVLDFNAVTAEGTDSVLALSRTAIDAAERVGLVKREGDDFLSVVGSQEVEVPASSLHPGRFESFSAWIATLPPDTVVWIRAEKAESSWRSILLQPGHQRARQCRTVRRHDLSNVPEMAVVLYESRQLLDLDLSSADSRECLSELERSRRLFFFSNGETRITEAAPALVGV